MNTEVNTNVVLHKIFLYSYCFFFLICVKLFINIVLNSTVMLMLYFSAKPDEEHQLNKLEEWVKDIRHWILTRFY